MAERRRPFNRGRSRRGPPPPPLWQVLLRLQEAGGEGGKLIEGELRGRCVWCHAVPGIAADQLRAGCFGAPLRGQDANQYTVNGKRLKQSRKGEDEVEGEGGRVGAKRPRQTEWAEEVWRLSLLDAYFLQHNLGFMRIVLRETSSQSSDKDNEAKGFRILEGKDLFSALVERQKSFVELYAAYSHFRAEGWFLRSGLTFGSTFVLYKSHPSHAHSVSTAYVATEAKDSLSPMPSWQQVQCMSRLCVQVSKCCMVVVVGRPPLDVCIEEGALCLEKITVDKVQVGRFDPADPVLQPKKIAPARTGM